MDHSETIANLATALSAAQAEMPSVPFDSENGFLHNRYASLGAMIETARPILAKNGLSVSQIVVSYDGQIGVETVLMHMSGEWIANTAILPAGEEKGKSSAQVAGSTITYLRRYSYASILGLYADEDTDGNPSQPRQAQNAKQGSQKPPQAKPEHTSEKPQRPYTPQALREKTTAFLATKEQVFCTQEQAQKLAIVWKNILRHNNDKRHLVATYILTRPIEHFAELTGAEVEYLHLWLKNNAPAARQEAEAIVVLLAVGEAQEAA